MPKTAKTFRLSAQAIKQLQALKDRTGTNETAIIEIALALFEQGIIQTAEDRRTFGGEPSIEAGEAPNVQSDPVDEETQELLKKFPALKAEMSFPHRKKRKRKK